MPGSEPAGRYVFNWNEPHPNVDIDTMRRVVLEAVAELQAATAGVDDAYWLTDLLAGLLYGALDSIDALNADVAALAERITALEPPPPPPAPDEEG